MSGKQRSLSAVLVRFLRGRAAITALRVTPPSRVTRVTKYAVSCHGEALVTRNRAASRHWTALSV
jgi:hypothetical protein